MPGGLGSTHKVLILGKGVGAPALLGCLVSRMRVDMNRVGAAIGLVDHDRRLRSRDAARGIEPFWSWNTPIAWTGFILFADGDRVARARATRGSDRRRASSSFSRSCRFRSGSCSSSTTSSSKLALRRPARGSGAPAFGYAWSFATIWPAIFEGAELIAVRAGVLVFDTLTTSEYRSP